jgi:uncharacterized protein
MYSGFTKCGIIIVMEKLIVSVLPVPNVVFFPTTALPLYVEDPVFIKMLTDIVEADHYIAISLAQPIMTPTKYNYKGPQYRPFKTCGLGKPIILETYENGALKVLVKGVGKVCLHNLIQNLPYPKFEASMVHDLEEHPRSGNGMVNRMHKILLEWINTYVLDSVEREAFIDGLESVNHIVDYIAMLLVHDPELRQLILESNSLYERLHMLNALISDKPPYRLDVSTTKAIKEFEIIEKITDIAM